MEEARQDEKAGFAPGPIEASAVETSLVALPELVGLLQRPAHVHRMYWVVKRLFDLALGAFLLLLGAPLFALIAIVIKLDSPGPVFFLQIRMGQRLQLFNIIKFRTMYADVSPSPVAVLDDTNGLYRRPKFSQDPRVTRVGRVLRSLSMDELPQLINILFGDMSFIGPRPLALGESLMVPLMALGRYSVPAGLTGLAQIRDRHVMIESSRFDHDVEFIQKISLGLDLKIFFKTFSKIYDRG